MQKYCLTSCFKRNISAKWELILDVLLVLLIFFIIIIVGIVVSAIVGAILQFTYLYFGVNIFEYNPFLIGFLHIVGGLLLFALSYLLIEWGVTVYKAIFKFSKNLALNVVAPASAECRIFEPCTK